MINDIDEGRYFSMNLLQIMRMYYKAWQNIKENTIFNCCIKSEMLSKENEIKYSRVENDDGGFDWKIVVL